MRYKAPLLAILVLIATASASACSADDDGSSSPTPFVAYDGETLTVSKVGHGISGAFLVEGPFDVRLTGDVTPENARLYVWQITQAGLGFETRRVAGSGPKAMAEGTTQRPGPLLDITFDRGPGEFFVAVHTDPGNAWTMTVTNVTGVR